jgi:hypothetical protein
MYDQRNKCVKITDQRIRITTEVSVPDETTNRENRFVDILCCQGSPGHTSYQMLCLGMVLYAAYRGTEEQRNPSNQDGLVSLVRVSCLTISAHNFWIDWGSRG